jgi:hypothetical protein
LTGASAFAEPTADKTGAAAAGSAFAETSADKAGWVAVTLAGVSAGANGFWYSRGAVTTSMAVGVYSVEAAVVVVAGLMVGRFPRARPEPRVLPNEGAADDAGVVAVASAGAPDDSVEDMSMLLV